MKIHAYTNGNIVYHFCLLAILVLKACTKSLCNAFIGKSIQAFVFSMTNCLSGLSSTSSSFPHASTFQEVPHAKLKSQTLASCNCKFKDFCNKLHDIIDQDCLPMKSSLPLDDGPIIHKIAVLVAYSHNNQRCFNL